MSGGELMDRVRRRDSAALMELYDQYGRAAYSTALHYLRHEADAEDVVQDVFTLLWTHPDRYVESLGSFSTWLSRVVHNRAIDRLRSRRAYQKALLHASQKPPVPVERHGLSPEETEALDHVVGAIERLPREQRDILRLAYFGGLTQTQIASRLSQSLGTVKTRMRRALHRLRSCFRPDASCASCC